MSDQAQQINLFVKVVFFGLPAPSSYLLGEGAWACSVFHFHDGKKLGPLTDSNRMRILWHAARRGGI